MGQGSVKSEQAHVFYSNGIAIGVVNRDRYEQQGRQDCDAHQQIAKQLFRVPLGFAWPRNGRAFDGFPGLEIRGFRSAREASLQLRPYFLSAEVAKY
jgi:hypothetical protein